MSIQIRPINRDMPMLLPPDLREWVPEDDIVHFVIEAIEGMPTTQNTFHLNHRGTGSQQYSPKMMLMLLVYCFINGVFSSRKIERATYRDIAVRYLTADLHPDHDTICTFRRRNKQACKEAFHHILTLAKEMNVLKVGTISVDGTHIDANASKAKNVRFDRAEQLGKQLLLDIDELMRRAEEADNSETDDGQTLPKEIARRERLLEKMKRAQADLKKRAEAKAKAEYEKYEQKLQRREARLESGTCSGPEPKIPENPGPKPTDQANLTDDDSRLMRKNRRAEFRQSYNAQAAVDADGSQLILSVHVTNCASDAGELEPALANIDPRIGTPTAVLADNGYVNGDAIERLQRPKNEGGSELNIYIPVTSEDGNNQRRYDFRPPKEHTPKVIKDKRLLAMQTKMQTDDARKLYSKRKQTVEPVFGIIKSVLGFRKFHLRGLKNVSIEWSLVALAYNVKRLYALRRVATS